jgi:transcriptional regulator with XRE-family HTH domain
MRSNRPAFARKPGCPGVGERLKSERIRRGFKVYDFAAAIGVDQVTLTGIENRGVDTKVSILMRCAEVLDCSMDWLCGLED